MKISAYHKKLGDTVTLKTDYQSLDLFDKVVSYEPVFDVDAIQGFIADGVIYDEDMNKIFERKITYALTTQKGKKAEEVSE